MVSQVDKQSVLHISLSYLTLLSNLVLKSSLAYEAVVAASTLNLDVLIARLGTITFGLDNVVNTLYDVKCVQPPETRIDREEPYRMVESRVRHNARTYHIAEEVGGKHAVHPLCLVGTRASCYFLPREIFFGEKMLCATYSLTWFSNLRLLTWRWWRHQH